MVSSALLSISSTTRAKPKSAIFARPKTNYLKKVYNHAIKYLQV